MLILNNRQQKIVVQIMENLHRNFYNWADIDEIDFDKSEYNELIQFQKDLNICGQDFKLDEILKTLSKFNNIEEGLNDE